MKAKKEKKKADQEIKCSGISDHVKNAQLWLNTLGFNLVLV